MFAGKHYSNVLESESHNCLVGDMNYFQDPLVTTPFLYLNKM
jgi:hypothetical protein